MAYTTSGGEKGLGQFTAGATTLADLNKLLELLARVGNYRGPLTEDDRDDVAGDALYEGLMVYNLDTQALEVYDGSGWQVVYQDSGWSNITLATGWTAVPGFTPRSRVINDVLYIEGAVDRGVGGAFAAIGTTVAGHRPTKTTFYGAAATVISGSSGYAELTIDTTGEILIGAYTNMSGAAGWRVPLTGNIVRS